MLPLLAGEAETGFRTAGRVPTILPVFAQHVLPNVQTATIAAESRWADNVVHGMRGQRNV